MTLFKLDSRRPCALIMLSLLFVSFIAAAIVIKPVLGAWWNTDWQYRKMITIDYTKISADFTNFPFLINTTSSDLASHAQSDGDDIVFTDNSENKLNHEIEFYNASTGQLVAWVRANLSSTANTTLYMYYGNAGASNQQNRTGVWDSGFKGVWHLSETSGTDYDSTTNGNNGTYTGSSQDVAGRIDGADNFDGSDDYINVTASNTLDLTGDLTIEAWIYPKTWGENNWGRIVCRRTSSPSQGYEFLLDNNPAGGERLWFAAIGLTQYNSYSTNHSITLNTWQHVVVTRTSSSGEVKFYINGAASGTGNMTTITSAPARPTYIGIRDDLLREFNGIIDEVRISNSVRSAAWVSTEYSNQNSPSTFYSVGAEETTGVNTPPAVSNPSPANGTGGVPISLPELTFALSDSQSDLIDYNVTMTPDAIGGVKSGTGVSSGTTIHVPITGSLQFNTLYTWVVNATDPLGSGQTSTATYTFNTEVWYDTAWQYRKKIVIQYSKVSGDLTNFPILIDVTSSDFVTHAQSDGDDILFTNSLGIKLNHEIEYYNGSAGHLIAWVSANLSSTSNTILYVYYGNAAASSQANPASVWDTNYVLVQHFEEASGILEDSTSYNNDGTPMGGLNQTAQGKIDGAVGLDGVDDYVKVNDAATLDMGTGSFTLEGWIRPLNNIPNDFDLVWKGPPPGTQDSAYGLRIKATGGVRGGMQDVTAGYTTFTTYDSGTQYDDGNWHYIALSVDKQSNQQKVYADGNLLGTTDISSFTYNLSNARDLGIGKGMGIGNGTLDEVRVSKAVRSVAWTTTSYNNQKDTNTFYTLENEEALVGFPIMSDPDPSNGATNVQTTISKLSFTLQDTDNDAMNYTVTTSPDIGSGSGTNVYNGRYDVSVSSLSYSTTYAWHVNVTDGTNRTEAAFTFTTRPENYPPSISNPSPSNGAVGIQLNPTLSIQASDPDSNLMNVTFSTNASGTWQDIEIYTNVGDGTYTAQPSTMGAYNSLYYWCVTITDGKSTVVANYSFTTFDPLRNVGTWYCWGNPEMGRSATDPDRFYIVFQHIDTVPGGEEHSPYYAEFDRNLGWIATDQPVCDWSNEGIANGHPFMMYYDGQIHIAWSYGGDAQHDNATYSDLEMITADTFEDFQSMVPGNRSTPITENLNDRFVANAYDFDNDCVWAFGRNGGTHIEYWTWNPSSGWSTGTILTQTSPGWGPGLLPMNKTHYYLYYQVRESDTLRCVESFDAGQTWGSEQTVMNNVPDYSTRINFVRYGDNIYLVLLDETDYHVLLYNSTDGRNWTYAAEIYDQPSMIPCISMLSQTALLWATSNQGTGQIAAGVYFIPEMLANPGTPTNPYPEHGSTILLGDKIRLNVTVHGAQTYDVAFYWANGTFIGEDKLLREGEVASIEVTGLGNGTYSWYAIERGTTYDYWGNEPDTTTDEARSPTWSFEIENVYTLTVSTIGSGSVDLNNTGPYHYGDVVEFTADPDAGWSFDHWSGNLSGSATPATLIITDNMSVTATFTENVYTLTVNVIGNGSVDLNNTGPYHYGDVVEFTADPDADWSFDHWSGNLTGSANPATLTITEDSTVVAHFIQAIKPELDLNPTSVTCRKYCENFTIAINVINASNLEDFEFEIHYNTTLIDYVNVTWNAWETGTIAVDELSGNITGTTTGSPRTGNLTLITLTFHAAYHHMWKDENLVSGWANNQSGTIFFQWANLSYPSGPDLAYVRGGANQIDIGPDATYTFSPIQGDVDNTGEVDVFDLRTVSAYYNAKTGDPNWAEAVTYDLNGDGTIDIFDLIIVARNFGFKWDC